MTMQTGLIPSEKDICYLGARQALELFRTGELSPVELLQAQIERAEEVEPQINAFTETFFKSAMEQARCAERRYLSRSEDVRPLEGLSVTVKDILDQKGARTTYGSLIYRDNIASQDHPVVTRIKQAGGIIHARTATSELAFGWVTATRLWGVTRNPWNIDLTPGGSSGGAAASLAAGTSTFAIGSDSAGSIRVPAALCGVVGYKPPTGRVPDPVEGHDTYNVIGPMARQVADCALLQNVISGVHPSDIASLRDRIEVPSEFPASGRLRLALSTDLGKTAPADNILRVIYRLVDKMRCSGCIVDEPTIDWPSSVSENAKFYAAGLIADSLKRLLESHKADVCGYILSAARVAASCPPSIYSDAAAVARQLYTAVSGILEDYDALICPVVLTNRIGAEQMPWQTNFVNGTTLDSDYDWVVTPHFNMLGQLPAMSVPIGVDEDGIPVGIQIVTRSFDDARAFQVAVEVERNVCYFSS